MGIVGSGRPSLERNQAKQPRGRSIHAFTPAPQKKAHLDEEALPLGVAVQRGGVHADVHVVALAEALGRLHEEPVALLWGWGLGMGVEKPEATATPRPAVMVRGGFES